MSDPTHWYDANASAVAPRYESIAAEVLHAALVDLLPKAPALVLEVGAGTGRDAAWIVSRGLEVVAIEPSSAMRAEGQRLHPTSSIRWIADSLPGLEHTVRLGLAFDLILLSAVWMHVRLHDRDRAFRKLITLLKPGGLLAISLRHGPAEPERGIYPVSSAEIERLACEHGAFVQRTTERKDELGRAEVHWTHLAVRLPDDGTGALPLLRHIILNDDKASTYKLALLRVLCRIAISASGYSRDAGDDYVAIPLGLVALYWIRVFKRLLARDLPQSPVNRGDENLGFVREGFRRLGDSSQLDLRIGMLFTGDRAAALHTALRDACDTIARMPVHFITYPNGGPVLPTKRVGRVPRPQAISLDKVYLSGFGELCVPRPLWQALQRFDVWIEPALIAEWARLMKVYAASQGRSLEDGAIAEAMTWSEPIRDVRIARGQALRLMERSDLPCVWSGRKLSHETLDIDHCFPWTAWPCEDLWNLLPVHRRVNQNQKRDRLPADALLRSAQDRIEAWWDAGYLRCDNPVIPERFKAQARASLPIVSGSDLRLHDVFAALNLQRLRLKHDQQVPEWSG
jgi:SAM-dependent methyltransferase